MNNEFPGLWLDKQFLCICRQTASPIDLKLGILTHYGTLHIWLIYCHTPLNSWCPGLWLDKHFQCICRQTTDGTDLKLGWWIQCWTHCFTMTVPWSTGPVAPKTDKAPSASPLQKRGIADITSVLCRQWLRWYGHVQQATSCIKSITNFPIPSTRKHGRPRKTWSSWMCEDWCQWMSPGWHDPARQRCMESWC